MKQYQLVTALHGNEYMPTLAIADLGLPQIVGNPRALAEGKRCIDADLNGVFGLKGDGYEHARAKELLKLITTDTPVVDFHSFSPESEPFAIYVDEAMLPLAKKLGVKNIVYMKLNYKQGKALLHMRPGVSVEVGKYTAPESYRLTQQIVANLQADVVPKMRHKIYEVYDIITKPGEYQNFRRHKEGFYPVLAGQQSYDFYGLKARKIA